MVLCLYSSDDCLDSLYGEDDLLDDTSTDNNNGGSTTDGDNQSISAQVRGILTWFVWRGEVKSW